MAKQPSFEEQMEQLQTIVNNLQQGNLSLEESLEQFKTGMELSNGLQKQLKNAETTVAHLMKDDGQEVNDPTDSKQDDGSGHQGYQSQFKQSGFKDAQDQKLDLF